MTAEANSRLSHLREAVVLVYALYMRLEKIRHGGVGALRCGRFREHRGETWASFSGSSMSRSSASRPFFFNAAAKSRL